jgi:flagellar motor component MotA
MNKKPSYNRVLSAPTAPDLEQNILKRYVQIAQLMQSKGLEELVRMPIEELSARDALRLIVKGIKIERLILLYKSA